MLANEYILNSQTLYTSSATKGQILGSRGKDQIGRTYRYVRAGGTSLVVGKLQAAAATDTNFVDMAVQAAAAANTVGPSTISVTLGGSATTANQFDDGILTTSATPGQGQSFHIVSHDVQATTNGTCKFYVEENIQVALTTASTATVAQSPWADVIISPTTQTGMAVGGAVFAVTNAQFGWVQTGGIGVCLGDATASTAAAMSLSQSVSTAGAVTKSVTLSPQIATSLYVASVSAKYEPLYWRID